MDVPSIYSTRNTSSLVPLEYTTRGIPAIVISTDATENRIARLLALGAKGYITKPFRPETLRAEPERTLGVPCD